MKRMYSLLGAVLLVASLLMVACDGKKEISIKDISGTWHVDFDKVVDANPHMRNETASPAALAEMRKEFELVEVIIDGDKKTVSINMDDIAARSFEVLAIKGARMRIKIGDKAFDLTKDGKDSLIMGKVGDDTMIYLWRK